MGSKSFGDFVFGFVVADRRGRGDNNSDDVVGASEGAGVEHVGGAARLWCIGLNGSLGIALDAVGRGDRDSYWLVWAIGWLW